MSGLLKAGEDLRSNRDRLRANARDELPGELALHQELGLLADAPSFSNSLSQLRETLDEPTPP